MRKKITWKTGGVNRNELIVAVDIGMRKNTGYFRSFEGAERVPFDFFNDGHGYVWFYEKMIRFTREHGLERAVVGFESTGVYGLPFLHFLLKRGVRMVQVNPMHTKRLKELTGNSPNKTDKKDPRVIADIMMLGHMLSVVVPQGASAELRELTHARERAMSRRTTVYNQLHDRVFVMFPELVVIMKHLDSASARHLLRNHPTPEEIEALGVDALGMVFRKVSRGRFGNNHARKLVEAARSSAGIREGRTSILVEINYLLDEFDRMKVFIKGLENRMEQYVEKVPASQYLFTIKGMGLIGVACLIGEVGDFSNFRKADELVKLAGLNLYEVSSGIHRGKRRITKRGRPLMRKMLYLMVLNMVKSGGIFHDRYQGMIQRGMPRMKALVALSEKLLRIAWGVVRKQTAYQPMVSCVKRAA